MSINAQVTNQDEFMSYIEEMATRRAELQDKIRQRKHRIAETPMPMNVVQTTDAGIVTGNVGVPVLNPRMQLVNVVTEGLGYRGETSPPTAKDFTKWVKINLLFNVQMSHMPASRIPTTASLVGTVNAAIATKSTTRETSGFPELIRSPGYALPRAGAEAAAALPQRPAAPTRSGWT